MRQAGNVLVGLLCLIALITMIIGIVLLTIAVSSVYAKDLPPGFSGSGMNNAIENRDVKFTQEILPAPKLPKATTQYIQPSATKEYWQNTRTP